jgi:tight adherence protein B
VLIPAGLALAVALGAPIPVIAAVALALAQPVWFLVVAAGWGIVARRKGTGPSPEDEAAFLHGLAAELTAGASIRAAVVAAAARSPGLDLVPAARLCAAGLPAVEIGEQIGRALPVNGKATAAAFRLAAATGGRVATVVQSLAVRADEVGRLAGERRALTAQARLSAWIVGGGPAALVLFGVVSGLGPDLDDLGPAGPPVLAGGLALIGAGALVVWLMVRRAGR